MNIHPSHHYVVVVDGDDDDGSHRYHLQYNSDDDDDHDDDVAGEARSGFEPSSIVATGNNTTTTAIACRRSISPEYQELIPESYDVIWNDDFFDDREDVIAVFDFDCDAIIAYRMPLQIMMNTFLSVGLVLYLIILILLIIHHSIWIWYFIYCGSLLGIPLFRNTFAPPFYVKSNLRWKAKALHVAITREGIELVQSRRKAWCGFVMCDVNTVITKIPRDTILTCDVLPPDDDAGGPCGFGRVTLYTVFIETETAMKIGYPALRLVGLRDPYGFKTVLSAVKRHTFPPAEAVSSEIPQSLDADQQLEGINSPSQIEIV